MKITKQRLKEIIKEELETMSVGADIEGYPEPEEDEDPMAGRLGTREEQLLSRILVRAVVDRYASPEEIEHGLGLEMTPELAHFIQYLKANPMYGSSGLEEASDTKVSKKRKEKTLPDSKKSANKAYNKASRAQAKRNLKK
jgi:hypothetical protein